MENNLCLKTVNNLCQCSFFVPAYQRGYRWTEQEVSDLLNDIDDFRPREIPNSDEKTWYCLQPLVVKKRLSDGYELIDGQQRLTTVYLILFYLNQDFVENKRDLLFEIDYETRKGTKDFLKKPQELNDTNIDFYYISRAYKTIEDWFEKKDQDFDKGAFRSKIKFNTRFIWYETSELDTIPVFSRLNIGKISLTNSELIKALFLNSSNYGKEDSDRIRQRQFEIAAEWDTIENGLQDDRLWYFLSDVQKQDNRIELIFDLMSGEQKADSYATFRFFNNRMQKHDQENLNLNWKEVKDHYQRFDEWFKKREWYHKIGFVLYVKILSISDLYENSYSMSKNAFSDYLDNAIKTYYKKTCLTELQYGDSKTKSVLLLYNIITMLKNDKDRSYFPFDAFKVERWDIEHIASLKDAIPERTERKQWLNDVKPYVDINVPGGKNILKNIDSCDIYDDTEFERLFEQVNDHFNYKIINQETGVIEDINGISNLTLLDSFTNRSYKNAVFPIKRKTIIERDKSGGFVPLCTKNTFLKYFSDYPPKISFWTEDDRQKYEDDLSMVLNQYMEVE